MKHVPRSDPRFILLNTLILRSSLTLPKISTKGSEMLASRCNLIWTYRHNVDWINSEPNGMKEIAIG